MTLNKQQFIEEKKKAFYEQHLKNKGEWGVFIQQEAINGAWNYIETLLNEAITKAVESLKINQTPIFEDEDVVSMTYYFDNHQYPASSDVIIALNKKIDELLK